MIKFKTLFRKAHGASGSGSTVKNKGADRAKTNLTNHFESAVSNNSANNCDNNEFEKPAVTCSVPLSKLNNFGSDVGAVESMRSKANSSSKMNDVANVDVEFENVKKQLDIVLDEKSNLELTLQELIKSHGELETVKKEIETLKVSDCIFLSLKNLDF